MNKILKVLVLLSLLSVANTTFAWNSTPDAKIVAVVVWEGAEVTNPLYFQRSDNVWCYIPAGEKTLQSLILTLYASGKTAEIHCYDLADGKMVDLTNPAHKLHRIIAR